MITVDDGAFVPAPAADHTILVGPSGCSLVKGAPFQAGVECDTPGCGCRVNSFIWISHSRSAIYFETPKVASTAIKKALGIRPPGIIHALYPLLARHHHLDPLAIAVLVEREDLVAGARAVLKHAAEKYADDIEVVGGTAAVRPHYQARYFKADYEMFFGTPMQAVAQYPRYFSFAVARDPASRFLSNFSMFTHVPLRMKQIEHLFGRAASSITLREFVAGIREKKNHHWERQARFLPLGGQEGGDAFGVSYLARMESLRDDWGHIKPEIFLAADLEVVNRSQHPWEGMAMDEDVERAMREMYLDDYARLYPHRPLPAVGTR